MNKKTVARMARTVNLLSSVEVRLRKAIKASEKLKHPRPHDLRAAARMASICESISDLRNDINQSDQLEIPL